VNQEAKIHLALIQVSNLSSLLKGNEYESFLYGKLIGIEIELNRQLALLTNAKYSSKIKTVQNQE